MTRYYCFRMGRVVEADAKGECPECGPTTHADVLAAFDRAIALAEGDEK